MHATTSDSAVPKYENENILRNENHTKSVVKTIKFIVFARG